ncbi:hypothetical protein [Roseibium aggregatum]|uniref:Uncharacterized protein n=1 Tax=Roseibium aggregatum TaxID=187304 RepID=A0A939EDV3_9HYPH|nr:hypothetical protein [Roseibium aggregatum]MBN9669789.1 hypothetical protein [Roseibium aggregatum]
MLKRTLTMALFLAVSGMSGFVPELTSSEARAETFFCESTRTPNGDAKYCNFLLFDQKFRRHQQVVVPKGGRRDVAINGRYNVFCVLVQNHRGVPDNIAYRKQQCRKSDTGRNYQAPIKDLNMRRGRDPFSTWAN